jgi:HAD superfamily hydrolase (TIGR01484 family)
MDNITTLTREEASGIRYIFTDIDDTITTGAKLHPEPYQALWDLKEAGFILIPVTGRAAGRCDIIAREWPVDAVLAESGGVAFWETSTQATDRAGKMTENKTLHRELYPGAVYNTDPLFERVRQRVFAEVASAKLAKDQFSRLTDISFDYAEEAPVLSHADAERIAALAEAEGAEASISSIHVNIWKGKRDKLSAVRWFLNMRYNWTEDQAASVFYIGDAPNDEPLFQHFPLAAGVANVHRYKGMMTHYPRFVASQECGEGFAEIARLLIERSGRKGD